MLSTADRGEGDEQAAIFEIQGVFRAFWHGV
jgi:hypothetical protein